MSAGLRVAVVAGGPSSEASVSRASARGVARALEEAGHRPEVLELEAALLPRLASGAYDVVFPAVHGLLGEDGSLQGALDVLDVPYVGSGVLASALAMSKPHAKLVFRQVGLPLAEGAVVVAGSTPAAEAARVRALLGPGVVVKPGAGGSAIGVEILTASDPDSALAAALERALALGGDVLVEAFVTGSEATCAVLEDDDGTPRALPPTLIRPRAAGFYDYSSKYAPGGSEHLCPAPFAPELLARIQAAAVLAHRSLGCRDLSRVDFVVDEARGAFTVLEVNTLPGMTQTSLFPEAAGVTGISFAALCDRLVRRAASRPRVARPAAPPLPTA